MDVIHVSYQYSIGHSKVKLAISSFSCPGYPGTDTSEPQLFHEISRYGVLRRPTALTKPGRATYSLTGYLELSVLDSEGLPQRVMTFEFLATFGTPWYLVNNGKQLGVAANSWLNYLTAWAPRGFRPLRHGHHQ